ncbi:MAG: hypothetical protein ACOC16_00530 [Nanoarchaeota archaeon]
MIEELKNKLVLCIMNTKNLRHLDSFFVKNRLEKYILTYADSFKKLKIEVNRKGIEKIEKDKEFKKIIKNIRDDLRILYGSFLTNDFLKIKKINLKKSNLNINEYLKLHKSTKERIDYYEQIYDEIFDWYKPKKIADLACGLNPLSYNLIEKKLNYKPFFLAVDLSSQDMLFLNNFFRENNIDGLAQNYDITELNFLDNKKFKRCDMVFFFKALDSFEYIKKNISKKIIQEIKINKIVVSFATKSLIAKKEFKKERRNWFFNFLEKQNYDYKVFEVENEMFILIDKSIK